MRCVSFLAIVMTLVLTACTAASPAVPAPAAPGGERPAPSAGPKRLRVAIVGDPVTVFPGVDLRQASAIVELEGLVNSGLAVQDPERIARPQLTDALPTTDNGRWLVHPDGRMETTWKILPGAMWHDGRPLTSSDLLFTLQVGQDRALPNFGHAAFALIEDAQEIDPQTVVVRWSKPYIAADELFGPIIMPMPRHLLETPYTQDKASFLQLPYWTTDHVGTGAYKVRQFVLGSHAVLDAFDRYPLGRPKIDEVEVKFIRDQTTVAANLLSGAVEATMGRGISIEQAREIRDQWKDGKIAELALVSWVRIHPQFINPNPTLVGDLRFRQALYHAIDRQEIVDTVQAGLVPVADFIPSPRSAEGAEVGKSMVRYPYDARRAAELLAGLGLTPGPDGVLQDGSGRRVSVELRTTADNDARRKALLAVASYWQRVGVAVEPTIVPEQLQGDRQYRAEFPAFEVNRGGAEIAGLNQYHSRAIRLPENSYRGSTGTNYPRYSTPELDGLIDRFVATIPHAERLQIAGQVVNHLTANVAQMGLYFDAEPAMVSNRLKGFDGYVWESHKWELS
jgi:peptide/nickel transport system substrate-binding protein